jgi:hypothetical protein
MEWPGIATTVGIVLILTLIGVGSRDDFHLKDYASVIAAFVAVGGAVLAYHGAMAKVYEDRDRERRELNRKRLGVYLRLRFGLEGLANVAAAKSFQLDPPPSDSGGHLVNPTVDIVKLRIEDGADLADAWNNLDLFPREISIRVDRIRKQLRAIEEMLEGLPTFGVRLMSLFTPGELHGNYAQTVRDLELTARNAIAALDIEIQRLAID